MKQKRIKAWAVVWAVSDMGVEKDTPISIMPEAEDGVRLKVKCRCHKSKWHYLDGYAVFEKREEAIVYARFGDKKMNPDFKVVPVEILFPTKSKK